MSPSWDRSVWIAAGPGGALEVAPEVADDGEGSVWFSAETGALSTWGSADVWDSVWAAVVRIALKKRAAFSCFFGAVFLRFGAASSSFTESSVSWRFLEDNSESSVVLLA